MASGRQLRVALIIETSRVYGRGLLRGIASYAKAHGPWVLTVEERLLTPDVPAWLGDWKGDGIIARVESAALEEALYETGLPVIDVRGTRAVNMPVVDTDNVKVSEMAVEHLRSRGFRNLAYCGFGGLNYSELRLQAFREAVERLGLSFFVYTSPADRGEELLDVERRGIYREPELRDWLLSLPKPAGIMACNDVRGQQIINVCREAGLSIPEQIALVGVDNDDVLCEISDPPMSSVEPDTQRIGYEAARLLERMIREGYRGRDRVLVPPKRLVARLSTDVFAVDDPDVARALSFIRTHATENLTVDAVARAAFLSRRVLERRFRSLLGRTPKEEILRVRLERVKELLRETDWPLAVIARNVGFEHPEYMNVVFKRELRITPGEYRRRHKETQSLNE